VRDVPFGRAVVATNLVSQRVRQNLPQPRGQFGFGRTAKLRKRPDRFEQRLLHNVRRIELRGEAAFELHARQESQPRLEPT